MKKSSLLKLTLLSIVLGLFSLTSFAQVMPQPSSACMVMRTVGFTEITVDYSSPGVKGREIYGDLVSYDQAWRAGANAATKITFGTGVKIAGENVRAGSYQLFITPSENDDWMVHISTAGSVFEYMDSETGKIDMEGLAMKDVATAKVTPTTLSDMQERLVYHVEQADNGNAIVSMAWADKRVSFDVEIDQMAIMNQMKESVEMSIK